MEVHILEVKSDQAKSIFHIPIPNVLNAAGISYQTALKQYNIGKEIVIPELNISYPVEYAAIENGEIYEYQITVKYSANLSNAQKKQVIENEYTVKKNIILNSIQERLEFWQMAWDVGV